MLKFRRVFAGTYTADDTSKRYVVEGGRSWTLRVRELATTADVVHTVGQPDIVVSGGHDSKRLAVLVARQYSGLGDGYRQHQHGGQERITRAIGLAYDIAKEEGW